MTASPPGRRAIVIHRSGGRGSDFEHLVEAHRLVVVYTVVTDSTGKLGALIAVQHVLEHDADVVVLPRMTCQEVRDDRSWYAVTALAELVTSTGIVERIPFPTFPSGGP
ncbi:hypothetical protein [Nocardia sp. X0981]